LKENTMNDVIDEGAVCGLDGCSTSPMTEVVPKTVDTGSIPNPDSGVPTVDPYFWQNGVMVDIGSFGGVWGVANFINSGGQVVGWSYLSSKSCVI
jgi:uncharacterized membrane protein